MNWFLLPLSPHPHVILHEGFTRSCRIHCFKKRSKTFSLEGEGARRADEGEIGNQPENPSLSLNILIQITLLENHDH